MVGPDFHGIDEPDVYVKVGSPELPEVIEVAKDWTEPDDPGTWKKQSEVASETAKPVIEQPESSQHEIEELTSQAEQFASEGGRYA